MICTEIDFITWFVEYTIRAKGFEEEKNFLHSTVRDKMVRRDRHI